MEEEFLEIVRSLKPSPKTFYMALDIFDQLWKEREGQAKDHTKALKQQLALIDRKVNQFLNCIVVADNAILIDTYEHKIRGLQEEKVILAEKIRNFGRPIETFEDTFRTAITFLGNPLKIWESECIEQRRMLLLMAFTDKITYDRNQGFRTAAMSQPFLLLDELKGVNMKWWGHPSFISLNLLIYNNSYRYEL